MARRLEELDDRRAAVAAPPGGARRRLDDRVADVGRARRLEAALRARQVAGRQATNFGL